MICIRSIADINEIRHSFELICVLSKAMFVKQWWILPYRQTLILVPNHFNLFLLHSWSFLDLNFWSASSYRIIRNAMFCGDYSVPCESFCNLHAMIMWCLANIYPLCRLIYILDVICIGSIVDMNELECSFELICAFYKHFWNND